MLQRAADESGRPPSLLLLPASSTSSWGEMPGTVCGAETDSSSGQLWALDLFGGDMFGGGTNLIPERLLSRVHVQYTALTGSQVNIPDECAVIKKKAVGFM